MEFHSDVFFLSLATFLIGMWLCSLIFLPQLKAWMDQRQKGVEDQLATAEKRHKEAESLKGEFEAKVKALEGQTVETLRQARQDASKMKDEIVQASRKEAEMILSEARKALENERREVTQALQKQVGQMALEIAQKVVRSSVDAKAQEKLVAENIKELEARKN